MHAAECSVDSEYYHEPQGVENLVCDPCQGSNDERIIHSGTSQCYVNEVSRRRILPSYFTDIIYIHDWFNLRKNIGIPP